jgi:phosphomannomutase
MEERFLLNQRKVNKSCQRFVFTSLYGPAFDFMKKLFANFGFPNQYYADLPTPQAGIEFPGVPMPSVSKLGLLALRQARQTAERHDSKVIIGTDPIGESIIVAE